MSMNAGSTPVTLVETLDAKIADAVERVLRAQGIDVHRSRVTLPLPDPRLRQQGIRLEVMPHDEPVARKIADDLMMRRARLLSFPRARRDDGAGSPAGEGGFFFDGGSFDGGDCDGGGCD